MSNSSDGANANAPKLAQGPAARSDAKRNLESIIVAARKIFTHTGVDAPVRDIAEEAGVGLATLYRHFPDRTALIVAVFKHEVDACVDAGARLAREFPPGQALTKWLDVYADFVATKRGLAPALHSGEPAYSNLRAYFDDKMRPAVEKLLETAVSSGEVRDDVNANEIISAVSSLCMSTYMGKELIKKMVALFADGLRSKPAD